MLDNLLYYMFLRHLNDQTCIHTHVVIRYSCIHVYMYMYTCTCTFSRVVFMLQAIVCIGSLYFHSLLLDSGLFILYRFTEHMHAFHPENTIMPHDTGGGGAVTLATGHVTNDALTIIEHG